MIPKTKETKEGDQMGEPCTQKHRIDRLEADVKELKDTDKKHSEDITELKEGQAESRIFQRLIMENLADIKAMIAQKKSDKPQQSPNKEWIDLVKYVIGGTILVIVGWMASSTLGGS